LSDGPAPKAARSREAVIAANHREYDRGVDPLLELLVYRPCHDGWRFTNLGGRAVLDAIGQRAQQAPGRVLEIGAGLADTCRYLVREYGCRVTALELNRAQLEAARSALAQDPKTLGQIEVLEGDLLDWEPPRPRPYGVVFAIDTMMMIPELERALASALRLVNTDGALFVAEIMGGPALTPETRQYVWDEAGIANLSTPAQYETSLRAAGAQAIQGRDLGEVALANLAKMSAAIDEHEDEVRAIGGTEALEKWLDITRSYARMFRERQLLYWMVTCGPPQPAPGVTGSRLPAPRGPRSRRRAG
jgi:sarcosine/dimethylglycine N-methyltransferase